MKTICSTPIWNNSYTINEYSVSDSPIIQIISAANEDGVIVFNEEGFAYLLDKDTFKVLDGHILSEHQLSCVAEIAPKAKTRAVAVADARGGLNLFNLSFDTSTSLGKKPFPITAIQGLSDNRTLLSYPVGDGRCRIEMISSSTGEHYSHLDYSGTRRIRDFACPEVFLTMKEGWVLAGADTDIIEIGFKGRHIFKKGSHPLKENFYLDEIACTAIGEYHAGKELYPTSEDTPICDDVPYAYDEDEKISTISLNEEVLVLTETNNLFIKDRINEINKNVEFDKEVFFTKHLHWPLGRIILGSPNGGIIVVDFRNNCSRFFFDV